jgi:hypothetical protein
VLDLARICALTTLLPFASMGQLAIVNAPASFTIVWSIIKPWLSKETAEKVDILGSDYKDVLLNIVDADCLPSTLGGTCECKEAGGCHLSGVGPWLDGRVGWGPNSKPDEKISNKRLSGDETTDKEGVNACTSFMEERNIDSVAESTKCKDGYAQTSPMEDGKVGEGID